MSREGNWETKLRIGYAIPYNNKMHSRKDGCQSVYCCLYEGIMGDFYLFFYFLYFFSVFKPEHIFYNQKNKTL